MENDANLQVTFSKRRQSLFKKASELCTLCGVGMGVVVFSPGQKVFSFGNPDVRSVFNNFKNHNHNPLITNDGLNPTIQNLNSLLTQELTTLEMEKKRTKEIDGIKNKREETEKWWEKPPNQLDLNQNTCLISALENLKMELESQQPQHLQASDPPNYYGGSYNNIVGSGGNVDLFDQTRTFDGNASNYNPNMINSNHGPMFGYNDNNNVFEPFGPRSNLNLPK
ncbi:hypothetical protein Bca101_102295 [Brassica carinata]